MENIKVLDLCIKVDDKIISELCPKITQENIVATVQNIKQQLLNNDFDKEKIFCIYDASVEILQNILKYSYGNKVDENKKREADGKFTLSYNSITHKAVIVSENLITALQADVIKQRVKEVSGLDEKELRKLLRTKMKSKRDGHENGAGLGFATIATKISEPIQVTFEEILDDVIKYKLKIVI